MKKYHKDLTMRELMLAVRDLHGQKSKELKTTEAALRKKSAECQTLSEKCQAQQGEIEHLRESISSMANDKGIAIKLGKDLLESIQHIVAGASGIAFKLVSSKGPRPNSVAWARQLAMFLCYEHGCGSSTEIGERFGGFDHGTVIYACKTVRSYISMYKDKRLLYDECENQIALITQSRSVAAAAGK